MALSDTAEYWWKDPKMPYMGRKFIHIEKSSCGHINDMTGNNRISKYLNDINCFACLELIKENGNVYDLKEGTSPAQQSAIDKEKNKFKYGKCPCGSAMCIRKNNKNKKEFMGCVNYPTCKLTKSI